jgi:hypothetical protein
MSINKKDLGVVQVVEDLTDHPGFSRLWTIQEVVYAQYARALCGTYSLNFEKLIEFSILMLFNNASQADQILGYDDQIRQIMTNWDAIRVFNSNMRGIDTTPSGLISMMTSIRECGATEPKGKIFVLCGVFMDMGTVSISCRQIPVHFWEPCNGKP